MIDDDDIDLAEAAQVEPKWVIKNLLPVGLTILGAPPKSGKSLWALIFAGIVAKWDIKSLPSNWRKNTNDAGHSLLITSEATPGSLRVDMEKGLRFPLSKDHEGFISISDDPWRYIISMELGKDSHKDILNKIDRYDENDEFVGPRLVVLDPLIDFHDADENSAGQMIRVLKPLREWAIKHDCAIVVVHHTGKPAQENRKGYEYGSLDLRGTSAIFGKADAVIILTSLKEGQVSPVKVRAIFKRAEGFTAEIELAVWNSNLEEGKEKLGEIDQLIVLNQKLPISLLAQKVGLSEQDISFRFNALKKRGFLA